MIQLYQKITQIMRAGCNARKYVEADHAWLKVTGDLKSVLEEVAH